MRRRVSILSCALAFSAGALLWSDGARAADPTSADCVAANEASLKLGNEHHLRANRNQLLVCSSSACPTDIRLECVRRVDEVNAAIPTVIFEAKDGAGNDLSAVKVTMDGQVLAEQLEGTALSIDPGEHTFVFETAGQSPLTKSFIINESQKDRREPIVLGPVAPAAPVAPSPSPALGELSPASPPTATGLGTQKILAIVAGSVGVVGLGLGTAFGVMAMSKKSTAESACGASECPTQAGVDDWSSAKSAAQLSDVFFAVGGVGIAGGAVLWFTAKSPPASGATMQVGVGPGSVQWKGVW